MHVLRPCGSHTSSNANKNDVHEEQHSLSMLRSIFTEKSPAEVEKAVKMSYGNITMAADQLLANSEGTVKHNQYTGV